MSITDADQKSCHIEGYSVLNSVGLPSYRVEHIEEKCVELYQVEVIESSGLTSLFGVGMKQWTDCLLEPVWDKIDFCGFLDSTAQLHSVNEMQTEKSNLSAKTKSFKVRSVTLLSSLCSRDTAFKAGFLFKSIKLMQI